MISDFCGTSHPACLQLTHNNSHRVSLVTTLLQPNFKSLLLSRYSLVAEEDPRTKNFYVVVIGEYYVCLLNDKLLSLSNNSITHRQSAREFTPGPATSHHSATHYFHSGTTRPQYTSLKLIKHNIY